MDALRRGGSSGRGAADPMTDTAAAALSKLRENVGLAYRGEPRAVDLLLTALLARGHVLIEDVPGVGKTTLARALGRSLSLDFRRIQFTSDTLPADVLGISVFHSPRDRFEFHPGPIFANIVLADEINRATPEDAVGAARGDERGRGDGRVASAASCRSPSWSSRRRTRSSTSAPIRCPESQMDRFFLRLSLGYPAAEEEKMLLRRGGTERVLAAIPAVLGARAGPRAPGRDREGRRLGPPARLPPRPRARHAQHRGAAAAGLDARRAGALPRGPGPRAAARPHLRDARTTPRRVAEAVLAHRILSVSSDGFGAGGREQEIVRKILAQVPVPV